ncbi:MAG: HIT family protein [Deltaproteobacteria bacterium]|jgi:diadenosine tetraphosphate (Ap4A) HIT family hydrolase|nr:HIT family protein [Deltaproteobacteria bacterium]
MNATATKFGYPQSLLCEFESWAVLLRPAQVTLGSLVLVCSEPVGQFGQISSEASAELGRAAASIESALGRAFSFDRINYLMLMMVDPDVHFHVLPRYEIERSFEGRTFRDDAWPGPPDITANLGLTESDQAALLEHLRGFF